MGVNGRAPGGWDRWAQYGIAQGAVATTSEVIFVNFWRLGQAGLTRGVPMHTTLSKAQTTPNASARLHWLQEGPTDAVHEPVTWRTNTLLWTPDMYQCMLWTAAACERLLREPPCLIESHSASWACCSCGAGGSAARGSGSGTWPWRRSSTAGRTRLSCAWWRRRKAGSWRRRR